MNEPRICVIGAGNLSTRRIYPYLGAAGAVLSGVCDRDAGKAERTARLFGGRAYTDYGAMVEEQQPDGVIVCIGPRAHAALAIDLMNRGFAVYTEKPPAATAADALEVARTSQRTGRLCMTAFKKRHAEAYRRAYDWLRQFPEGDWLSIGMDYASGAYPNDTPERSFLLDFAIHLIDLAPYLFGDVLEVFAFTKDEGTYAVSLRFANGSVGTMNFTDGRSFSVPTETVELTVRGGSFMSIHNSSRWRITEGGRCTEWREPPTFTSQGDSGNDTGHFTEIVEFISAIRAGTVPRSSIGESYKTMVLYEAIGEAARTGRPTPVTYADS